LCDQVFGYRLRFGDRSVSTDYSGEHSRT
jgi:hypothetical protein